MIKHIIKITIGGILFFLSCVPEHISDSVPGVNDPGIAWGNSKVDVQKNIREESIEVDGNIYCLSTDGMLTAFGFSNDELSSVISLRAQSMIDDSFLRNITKSYSLVGNISHDVIVYINEKTNTLLQIRDVTIKEEPYKAMISVPFSNSDSEETNSYYTVSISKRLITLGVGGSKTLSASVSPKSAIQQIDWTSEDPSVAVIENGVVYAKSLGETDIVATSMYEAKAICHVSVISIPSTAVDMGDGVYWAKKNYGASSIDDIGETMEWASSTVCSSYLYGHSLMLQDDPVFIKSGGEWRMPNKTEMDNLIKKCTWSNAVENGVKGRKIKATNGNEIFLPNTAASTSSNKRGAYWTSTAESDYFAYYLFFATSGDSYDSTLIGLRDRSKTTKTAVRPVLYLPEE